MINSFGELLSVVVGIMLTVMAMTDSGQYRKHGPRSLFGLFIALWVLGWATGKGII